MIAAYTDLQCGTGTVDIERVVLGNNVGVLNASLTKELVETNRQLMELEKRVSELEKK